MNKVILIGRLSKEIELRYTDSNKSVASSTIAVNRPKKEDGTQEADFINLVVWGKQAENLQKYCAKSSQIAVEGRIQVRTYDDKEGKKRYVTEVVAENIQFLDTKRQIQGQSSVQEKTNCEIIKDAMEEKDPFEEFGEQIKIEDSDLPF